MLIHATRSSVCLGDDFAGPEERDLVLDEQARLSELMKQLAGYVPYFGNVVWSIRCGDKVIGYLYSPGEKAAYRRHDGGEAHDEYHIKSPEGVKG